MCVCAACHLCRPETFPLCPFTAINIFYTLRPELVGSLLSFVDGTVGVRVGAAVKGVQPR